MDKYTWRQVKALSSSSHKPSSRWGHSCCVVGEQIVFFGGYADSNYMNDLWAFNSITMKWRQIETSGDLPAQRSNCSMNYDKQNNQIVIFGGGGSNKQRFNSINILNWQNKQWIEITPKQNQVAPWQRTYHVAELIFPYLVVYGGQGVADMDDLWLFNFNNLGWTEIKIPNDKVKPCARRFHSSVKMGNEFIVLAGCHGKYRCLSDVFSMDLTSMIKTGRTDQLQWRQRKLKNSSFLTRWGHSSSVYDNKIYIFGGRFSNDLNDILVADFEANTIRQMKITGQAPAARRRHCAGFIGSSMLAFGGFNGQYFNDLHYISVHESRPKYEISQVFDDKQLLKFLNSKQHADYCIRSQQNDDFYINIGMISKYFQSENQLDQFLQSLHEQFTIKELVDIFSVLYCGFGDLAINQDIKSKLRHPIFQNKLDKMNFQKQSIQKPSLQEWQRKMLKKTVQGMSPIIKLNEQAFTQYFMDIKNKGLFDFDLFIGKLKFGINKTKIMAKSQFFLNLFSSFDETQKITLLNILGQQNRIVFEMFFNFLDTDWLVISDNSSADTYLQLIALGDYFCVPVLTQLCCNELLTMLNNQNIDKIINFSINMRLSNVTKACCDYWIKKTAQTIKISDLKIEINKSYGSKKVCQQLESMVMRIGFDLAQVMMQSQKNTSTFTKKTFNSTSNMQKQNFETNVFYNH